MIASGMWQEIEEMKAIYDSAVACNMAADGDDVDLNSGIWQSIGFKEFLPFLEMRSKIAQKDEEKEKELEAMKNMGLENMKTATRQYARSQVKWIRIKFLNALETGEMEAGSTQQAKKKINKNGDIFLLDSTDIASFPESVSRTAVDIAKGASPTKNIPVLIFRLTLLYRFPIQHQAPPRRALSFSPRPHFPLPQTRLRPRRPPRPLGPAHLRAVQRDMYNRRRMANPQ